MNLHLVQGLDLEYGSLQEGLAVAAWRKQQRIDLYRTIAIVTAAVNPDKAHSALQKLLEEQFPEVKSSRTEFIDRAMEIMDEERTRSYSVAAVGHSMNKGPWGRMRNILKQKRRNRRP